MNIDKQENGNLVFHNETETFTFVDMGNYVGHQYREWYEKSPNCWRLMFYDEKKDDSPIHIEALVDSAGDYSKIMICQGNSERILLINRGTIDEDKIFEFDSDDHFFPQKTYIAFEDQYREKKHPSLQTYLSHEQQFLSHNGEVYTGHLSSNNYPNYFLISSANLSKMIGNQTALKTK